MKTQPNTPHTSKINWTMLVTQLVTIAFIAGWIPPEYEGALIAIIGLVVPTIVQVFRTWFTAP